MKKVALVIGMVMSCMAFNAFAGEAFEGFTLDAVRTSANGASNSTAGFTGLLSFRPSTYYGVELQGGLFGKAGPFTSGVEVDLSGVGFLPLGDTGFKLYGKAGLADTFVSATGVNANKFGATYGGGLEYSKNRGAIRLGFQHFKTGNDTLSPGQTTNLIGITFMSRMD